MPAVDPASKTATPAPEQSFDLFAGFLSYLVPGLGQIYQGRMLKGILFMVCLLGLFLYGMKLGTWSNVYMPETTQEENHFRVLPGFPLLGRQVGPDGNRENPTGKEKGFESPFLGSVFKRLPFAGQFWIGVAAWPAILQWGETWPLKKSNDSFWRVYEKAPPELRTADWPGKSICELQADGDKAWDLGWVYTVIAGVLNILVIYDAFAGPVFHPEEGTVPAPKTEAVPA
jgi:hypothetical protein